MRLMVDCVPLTVGGGVQVAIALLANLSMQSSVDWTGVATEGVRAALPAELAASERMTFLSKRSHLDRIRLRRQLGELERRAAPDVVFTVFGPQYFRAKAPHVVGFALPHLIYPRDPKLPRRGSFERAINAMQCAVFRRADRLVVETQTARHRLAKRVDIDPARISVIPNGLNPLLVGSSDTDRRKDGHFGVLVPSAYYQHKNLEIIPEVAAAASRLRPDLDFEFRFTLAPGSPEWLRLANRAAVLGVPNNLRALGVLRISDLGAAYCAASAVLLPTVREVSTAVYPESFFFRRPLLTSDTDFARELCGQAALFVPPRDAEAIARGLIAVVTDPALSNRLVLEGERQLERGYPTPAEKFRLQLDLLDRVASSKPCPERRSAALSTPASASKLKLAQVARIGGTVLPMAPISIPGRTAALRFHDDVAADWDIKYLTGGFRRRAAFIAAEVLPKTLAPGHWLDAGCGSGFFSRLLAERGASVIGVDGSGSMIASAQRLGEAAGLAGTTQFKVIPTVENLPFADASFDGALCLSVLEYLDSPYESLDELARVVAPGGLLIVSVPHRRSALRASQRLAMASIRSLMPQRWSYEALSRFLTTPRQLTEALEMRGFEPLKVLGFDPVLSGPIIRAIPPSLIFAVARKRSAESCGSAPTGRGAV